MRKLLLASAAIMGAGAAMGGYGYAQPATPAAPVAPVVTTPQMQTLTTGNSGNSANSNNNYQAAMLPGSVANPTPGTMVVRFNGAVWSEFGFGGGDGFVGAGPRLVTSGGLGPGPGANGTAVFTGTGANAGQKLNNYGMGTYFRLYPGVDAMATNGLRYGAQVELRENFISAQANTGATGGSGLTSGQTMYVRRAFVYAAGDNWGLLRFGQTDGVTGIFDNGITTGQQPGQGLWNGDAPIMTPNNGPTFPWFSQQGAEYGYDKIVYLSPQVFGFDFGIQYAPSNGNQEFGGAAAPGTPNLSSSITPPQGARFENQYTVGARYQGTFGPVALYGFGAYIGSGHVNYTGTAATAITTEGGPSLAQGSQYRGTFQNLSAGFVGAAVTWAGFTVGGAWQGGQYNGVMALKPTNGAPAEAWVADIYYTAGPIGVGVTYYQMDSQGAIGLTGLSQRHEDAFGVGGTYSVAPGMLAYWEYLYGQRHQAGFDLNNGKYFNQAGYAGGNDNHVQAAILGVRVRW
ncbi:MAG TPA: hypothetical protein VFL55_23395 [Acetobacteraceae bacterium]|nr:hypothetical protein [Acetobacteraceae bacterium]